MQTVEMQFIDAIHNYGLFQQAATLLIEEIPGLTPDDIYQRCSELAALQCELTEGQSHLFVLMEFVGPEILDQPFIGEFQRALQKSIRTSDMLRAEILHYKNADTRCRMELADKTNP